MIAESTGRGQRHAEARRLLAKGFKLCALHKESKRPMGDGWQLKPITEISDSVGGYGMPLALNGLCSIDPDNLELAREGLLRCGFDLDEIMDAGARTSSTRPGSGGRSTFQAPSGLGRIVFSSAKHGTILELRAGQSNLQDCLPGTVYLGKHGEGPYQQDYANKKTFDQAPELPVRVLEWWQRMGQDLAYRREQQALLCGDDARLAISGGEGKGAKLAFSSSCRVEFNEHHDVEDFLNRHGYSSDGGGRWSPSTATGAPSVRLIPGSIGLWHSDHASDPLYGTFDAWTAYVVLDHDGNLEAAVAAWVPKRMSLLANEFEDLDAKAREDQLFLFQLIENNDIVGNTPEELIVQVRQHLGSANLANDQVDAIIHRLEATTAMPNNVLAEQLGVEIPGHHPVALNWNSMPENPPEITFVIPGWMPDKVVTLFAAHGGTGKSYMSIYIALCLATGRHPFVLGQCIPRTKVLLYSAEDNLDVMMVRIKHYMRFLGLQREELVNWLKVLDATECDNVLFAGEERVNGRTTARFHWLAREVKSFSAQVLIFDNASDAIDANENDRAKVRQFMSALKRLAPAVLLLSHVDAASSMANIGDAKGYSGSTGWHNSARSRWFMARSKENDEVVLTLPKVNYAKAGAEVVIRWNDEHKLFEVCGVRQGIARATDHSVFLLMLVQKAVDLGKTVSPATTTPASVWNTIKDMPDCPHGLKSKDVAKLVNQWLDDGLVEIVDFQRRNRTHAQRLSLTNAGHEMVRDAAAQQGES